MTPESERTDRPSVDVVKLAREAKWLAVLT
jgi:hypothetical protein